MHQNRVTNSKTYPSNIPLTYPREDSVLQFDPSVDRGGRVITDLSGKRNHGTLLGNMSWVTAAGKRGFALDFPGNNNDVVEIPDSPELSSMAKLTVSTWIRFDTLPSVKGEDTFFVTKRVSIAPWQSYYLGASFASDKLFFSVRNASAMIGTSTFSTAVGVGQWCHCLGVYDGANVTIYVDGVAGPPVALTGNVLTGTDVVRLGANSTTNRRMDGQLSDIRIYNRALTAIDIRKLYEVGI